ncbi:MAG: hypothetical protein PHO27_07270 [Sulfuricurvum sp.]|nr:hypothetical protein [Sulfuricurvum sp.]
MKNEIIKCLCEEHGGATHHRFKKIFLNIFNDNTYKEVELYSFLCSCDRHYREMFFWLLEQVAEQRGNSSKMLQEIFDEMAKHSHKD